MNTAVIYAYYKHFLLGFGGSLFVSVFSLWLMAYCSEKILNRYTNSMSSKLKIVVYYILEMLGGVGFFCFAILAIVEFLYSIMLSLKFMWYLLVM